MFVLAMIAGFLWSRAILSIAITASFANALHPNTFLKYWQSWRKNYFALACFLFFFCYVLSGLWSANTGKWWVMVVNELPFAVLPFAFLALPLKEINVQKIIISFLLIAQLIIIFHSLILFVSDIDFYIQGYTHSHSLPTTKYNDHIRFSLSIVASLILVLYYFFENKTVFYKRFERYFLAASGILFIIYLHILASKTGILTLYISLFAFAVYFLVKSRFPKKFLYPALILILLLPVLLYFLIPTFREKIDYVKYEATLTLKKDSLNYNFSDAGRLLSYEMAFRVWKDNIWTGTGVGDLKDKMDAAYEKYHPQIPPENRLIPHSQYLFSLTALGLFSISLLILCWTSFFSHSPPVFYGRITSVIMMIAMLAEAMLEIQFGVFIFLFYLLFWLNLNPKVPEASEQRQYA